MRCSECDAVNAATSEKQDVEKQEKTPKCLRTPPDGQQLSDDAKLIKLFDWKVRTDMIELTMELRTGRRPTQSRGRLP
jgi:hypothetical protein